MLTEIPLRLFAATAVVAAFFLFVAVLNGHAAEDADEKAADGFFQASDWANAATAYEKLAKRDGKNPTVWFRLATSLYQLGGRDSDAVAAYVKADEIGVPGVPPAFCKFRVARTFARMKQADQAITWLGKAIDAGFMQYQALETTKEFDGIRDDARFKEAALRVRKVAFPCEFSPEFRRFDFWVGEWDVYSGPNIAGSSKIERILHDCVILENWTGTGMIGKSFNIYDPNTGKWKQTWVDSTGTMTEYTGVATGDQIAFQAVQPNPDGSKTRLKMTFTKLPDGKVRQFGESSTDDGKTWTTSYDLTYVKKTAP